MASHHIMAMKSIPFAHVNSMRLATTVPTYFSKLESDWLPVWGFSRGYFPNASKTWLVTKEGLQDAAASILLTRG